MAENGLLNLHRSPVGVSLLAMAVGQIRRHREQAHSYRGLCGELADK